LPDIEHAIRDGLVKWKPEPFTDGEHFDLAPVVLGRGWGDCDDLAPWLAAQLRMEGEVARAIAVKSGSQRYHAVVEREDGQILDPSRWAGMGSHGGGKGVHGQNYNPLVAPGWNALALVPHGGGWGARADLALDGDDHFASVSWDRDPKRALDRAVAGMIAGCDGMDLELGDGLADMAAACAPIASAARNRVYQRLRGGPMTESIVGLLGLPDSITNLAASVIPGGGIAKAGLDMLMPDGKPAPGGGGGGGGGGSQAPVTAPITSPAGSNSKGGNLTYVPGGGPIIVRF
jgi:hypothetical protein